jgi:cytoskeletal protein RodZ
MIRIGAAFAEERRRQGYSLEQVAKSTKIREEFLAAIERGDYKKLPSSAYAYGFVRNYAKFLGLPVEKSLAIFRREFDEKKNFEVLPKGLTKDDDFAIPKIRIGRGAVLGGLVLFVIVGFLLFQYRGALLDPGLEIEKPEENETVNSLTIEVQGNTDPSATLTVENEQVPVDGDGNFRKEITVFPGESAISFTSENRFGRKTKVERNIIVKPSD